MMELLGGKHWPDGLTITVIGPKTIMLPLMIAQAKREYDAGATDCGIHNYGNTHQVKVAIQGGMTNERD